MARSRFQPKTGIVPTVQKVAPTTSRRTRYPKHSWHIKFRPYQLQPMCIAPVSAGDTVKQLRFEGRVLTDGVLDQIAGWWSEMYWFYVRFSALDEYASAQRMAVTPGDNLAGLITASNTWTMHNGKGPDWLFMCMKPIIYNYFRPQSGAYNDYALDSVPAAGVVGQSWLDAISLETDLPSPSATDDYTGHWTHYEALRKARLVTMDYPEYLASQGVAVPEQLLQPLAEKRRPELLRYTRQFSYPANTVKEDGTGTVAAVSWVTAERMDRSIYCDEPGFIVGVSLVRPKVYRSGQVACGVSLLCDARTLAPPMLEDAPQESLWQVTGTGAGPVTKDNAVDYWVDTQGVYVLGDQFLNAAEGPRVTLPNQTTMAKTYPPDADVKALFTTPASKYYVRSDGMASFSIVGRHQLGTSPQAFTK